MEYFKVMYDSRVIFYEQKMFIRLATGFGQHTVQIDQMSCTPEVRFVLKIKSILAVGLVVIINPYFCSTLNSVK